MTNTVVLKKIKKLIYNNNITIRNEIKILINETIT